MCERFEYVPTSNGWPKQPYILEFFDSNHRDIYEKHWHDGIQIVFNYAGSIDDVMISGKRYEVQAGEAVVINCGAIHEIHHDGGSETLAISLSQQFLREEVPELKDKQLIDDPMKEDSPFVSKLQTLLTELYEVGKSNDTYTLRTKRVLYDVVDLLVKEFTVPKMLLNKHFKTEHAERQLLDILYYITEHLSEGIVVSDIANAFNLSSSYLVRYFKKHVGIIPSEYLQAQRLKRAEGYLLVTDKSIQMISDIVGFGSIRSFERVFKQNYMMTPREYRTKAHSRSVGIVDHK